MFWSNLNEEKCGSVLLNLESEETGLCFVAFLVKKETGPCLGMLLVRETDAF